MRVAIVGSRDFPNEQQVRAFVRGVARKHPDAVIVSGWARGVDRWAETEASRCGLHTISYRPVRRNGGFIVLRVIDGGLSEPVRDCDDPNGEVWTFDSFRDAAFERNGWIVEDAEVVCAFTIGSPGTANTLRHAERLGRTSFTFSPVSLLEEVAA